MPKKKDLLRMMQEASRFSNDYREQNIDPVHERADDAYHGVLENLQDYLERQRSNLFIPLTRNHTRRWKTTIVNAFYVSDDVVTLLYPDPYKQLFTNEVFNQRLELTTTFFHFLAHSCDAHVKYGNAIGKTGWEYAEGEREEFDEETGEMVKVVDPLVDKPFFEVVPFENIQYDYRVIGPEPLQNSPYLRHWTPMYINEIEEKFTSGAWKKPKGLDYGQIGDHGNSSLVRQSRHGDQADPQENKFDPNIPDKLSYDQVWIVENYFRIGGTDWTFMSLGDKYIVTEPTRTRDKFPHKQRPFAMSQFDPESFRSYSDGLPQLLTDLQAEENAIRNQRRDNVALVINAGHIVRRGAGINLTSLKTSFPGRVVLGDRIGQEDVRREEVLDVTASAYREEEITRRDAEEISGQSENRMGVAASARTTATEAAIKASSSGEMEGFVIKGFVETFVRPLLEMFMDNLVEFENDELVLIKAAAATALPPQRELLARCEVVINAGMGSTNKEIRAMRAERVANIMVQGGIPIVEMLREILPLYGFKNANRLLPPPGQMQGQDQLAGQQPGQAPQGPNGGQLGATGPGVSPGITAAAQEVPNFGGYAGGMVGGQA